MATIKKRIVTAVIATMGVLSCQVMASTASNKATPEHQKPPRTGEQVFNSVCSTCHRTGAFDAPIVGSKELWAPHIAKGMPTLYKHALHGFSIMPPRGTCQDCTDAEIKAAVNYMVSHSK